MSENHFQKKPDVVTSDFLQNRIFQKPDFSTTHALNNPIFKETCSINQVIKKSAPRSFFETNDFKTLILRHILLAKPKFSKTRFRKNSLRAFFSNIVFFENPGSSTDLVSAIRFSRKCIWENSAPRLFFLKKRILKIGFSMTFVSEVRVK